MLQRCVLSCPTFCSGRRRLLLSIKQIVFLNRGLLLQSRPSSCFFFFSLSLSSQTLSSRSKRTADPSCLSVSHPLILFYFFKTEQQESTEMRVFSRSSRGFCFLCSILVVLGVIMTHCFCS